MKQSPDHPEGETVGLGMQLFKLVRHMGDQILMIPIPSHSPRSCVWTNVPFCVLIMFALWLCDCDCVISDDFTACSARVRSLFYILYTLTGTQPGIDMQELFFGVD